MFEILGKVDLRGSCVVLQLFYRTYKRLWGIQYCTPKQFSERIKHVGCRPQEAGDAAVSDGEKSVGEISGTCPQFRPRDRPDTAHPSKLHYPKSIRTAPKNSQKWAAFIFQKTISTFAAFPFFLAPFLKTISTLISSWLHLATALTSGWKKANERLLSEEHGWGISWCLSQLSRHEADYKKFRPATAATTRELPFVIKPFHRCSLMCLSFFFGCSCLVSHSVFSDIISMLSILRPRHLVSPQLPVSELYCTYSPIFPPFFPPLAFFSFFRQCESRVWFDHDYCINVFLLPQWSRNKVQMQKLIFPQLFFPPDLFNAVRKRKGIWKACGIINMSDDVITLTRGPVSPHC